MNYEIKKLSGEEILTVTLKKSKDYYPIDKLCVYEFFDLPSEKRDSLYGAIKQRRLIDQSFKSKKFTIKTISESTIRCIRLI